MPADDDLLQALGLGALSDPQVICWRDLDPKTATDELDRLATWLDWFVDRYYLDHKTVPPCWHAHGALVEELSALRTLWEACYLEDAAPSDPIGFHRDLDTTLRRLREWTSRLGCSRINHRPEMHT
ncbi:hypothetical protein EV644_14517 [Kribbella orskensis]|uniref:Uncharacterized protein n=1 Tax=Kribbella orskensis TaxID=2512216 RepID=A0ABY2B6U9_9ACTN|nr:MULTISPECIES: hypothetical protein [Kribbella]TCN28603.1 hypothetical protein EV642_14817 [Kribbella sp. VKM Ac-2500]TCO08551.1 hypothetical protein EV644_14517 [Kribbella orskensis]